MAIIFQYSIEDILKMPQEHFYNLWAEWDEMQHEHKTGKGTFNLFQYEVDAIDKVKERYG